MNIDHVGWITRDVRKFERFWVDIIGYKQVHESELSLRMAQVLFGVYDTAKIRRYSKPDMGPDIEIHCFREGRCESFCQHFDRFGINHICLLIGGRGSRDEWVLQLPDDVVVHSFNNPKGWKNIFIQDYEGNWVELREELG
jgi:catechol 2,3-dioxygenase-like lactoylglutathione lyase family enzyme